MPKLHFAIVVAATVAAFSQPAHVNSAEPRLTGKPVKGFEPVERAAKEFMERVNCTAMTVAISYKGELVYSRGFGYRDEAGKKPTQPETLMRIASVSKPITAAAVKTLFAKGKLTPNTKAFEFLKLTPPPGTQPDPRLKNITVQNLLDHKGGWDREKSFDPMFKIHDAEIALGLKKPATPTDIIRWMLGKSLQFDPGNRSAYSNFGYCVLGRTIEKAAHQSFGNYVRDAVLKPAGIKDIKLGRNLPKDRDPREAWYPGADFDLEIMDANGGFIASAPALCQFLRRYWLNGDRRDSLTGQESTFFGSLPGTTAMVRQRKDGYDVAVLCNNRRDSRYNADNEDLKKMIDTALDNSRPNAKRN